MNKRSWLQWMAASGLASVWHQAYAQKGFPAKPIKLLVGFAAGGATDIAFKILASNASSIIDQPVVVENKPGAGMVIPAQMMKTTVPDGYTVAQIAVTVFRQAIIDKTDFDPLRDLSYIIGLSAYSFGLVVDASSPFKTLADYIDFAKKHPAQLTYGTTGTFSSAQLTMEDLAFQNNVQFNHVPYKGGIEALQALLGGHIMSMADAPSWAPYVESGKLRLLVTADEKRSERFPNVPTMIESGFNIVQNAPFGLAAPRDTDPAVIKKLHDIFKAAMEMDNFKEALKKYNLSSMYLSSSQFKQFAADIMKKERPLIERIGLKSN
jgi:tripartite-type tricarboxylate transporter receptor subunit TctC